MVDNMYHVFNDYCYGNKIKVFFISKSTVGKHFQMTTILNSQQEIDQMFYLDVSNINAWDSTNFAIT